MILVSQSGPLPYGQSSLLPWATFEQYGAKGDGVTDDTAAMQRALNIRQHIKVTNKTFKISTPLIEQFTGRIVEGTDSRHSIIMQAASDQHAVAWVSDPINDPNFGPGVHATSWRNMTIAGPGIFNAGTGAFSGSTGDGFHMQNSDSSHYGDEHYFSNLHINGFLRQMRITGQGNIAIVNCGLEYGGTGLSLGGAGSNSIKTFNSVTSNLATFNYDIGNSCVGISLHCGDTNVSTAGSCTQFNIGTSAKVSIYDCNAEQISASGNGLINNGTVALFNCYFNKGGGADNTCIVNNGSCMLVGGVSGFTTPYGGTVVPIVVDFNRITVPPGGAAGGAGSSSPGIALTASSLAWFLRTAQIQGNDLALFSATNLRLLIDESGKMSVGSGKLNLAGIPTSSAGLVTGDVWSNLGILTIV